MGTPITWRNVDVNPIGEVSRAMLSAQLGINQGFDSINGVLDKNRAVANANWEQQKTNNTNAYMNDLAGVKTPEELAAARGRFEEMIRAGGAQIDQQAARKALDAQTGILQDRLVSGQKFQDGQTDRTEAPIRDQIASLTAQGDFVGAKALLAQHNLRNEAPLYKANTEADRAMVLQKRGDTTYGRQEALAALAHPEALAAAQDTATTRNVLNLAAAAGEAHKMEMDKRQLQVGSIAKGLGLQVDNSGYPSIADMPKEDITKLHAGMKAAGITDPDTYLMGDTTAADAYMKNQQGKVPAHILKQNEANIRGVFSSVGPGAVGADAAKKERATAENDVRYKEVLDNNWFAPGSPNATKAYEQLSSDAPNLIDKTSGNAPEEDVADVQKFIFEMSTRGIDVGGGKFVSPPVQAVRNAIRTAGGGWFKDSTRAANAKDILKEYMKGVDIPKQIADSAEAEKYLRKREVIKKLNEK